MTLFRHISLSHFKARGTFGLQFCLLGKNCLETFNVVGTMGCLHRQSRWFPYPMKKRSALRFFLLNDALQ